MTHVATLTLSYATADRTERVERSLSPEVGDIDGDRTTASVSCADGDLEIRLEAADLVALRAGLNTWLALAGVAERAGTATTK